MRTVGPHSAMPNMPSAFFPEAIVAYRRAVTISPTETTPHYNLGLARKEAGDSEGAARPLTRFLSIAATLDSRRSLVISLLNDPTFNAKYEPEV